MLEENVGFEIPPLFRSSREPVAQLVEHRTFNAVVAGSSPARLTIREVRGIAVPGW